MSLAINYGTGISSAWSNAATFVPKLVVVAVGGGGIGTMSSRWEAVAGQYDQEKPRIAESVRDAPSARARALQAKDAASAQYANGTRSPDGSGERAGATRG